MPRPHPIRWLREHPRGADLLLAVVVTAIALAAHLLGSDGDDPDVLDPTWWSPVVVAATAFPIYWRRTFPLRSGLVVVAAQCIALFLGVNGAAFLGSAIAVYSIGAHASGPRRARVLVAIATMIAVLFVAGWVDGQNLLGEFVGTVAILVTAFVLGDNMRRRRDHLLSLAERAERAEREQELLADHRVNAERTRIARELHDVVAHSVSVMVIQAAAARRNLGGSTERAEDALAAIEETGRQTMTELRGILGVLRDSDEVGPDRSPQPTLADIDALLGQDADLPVELVVVEPIGELPHSVMLTGYRVVQEALTNVRRHAGPVERVEVRVERDDDRLAISVIDDGRGAAADDVGPGYGIIGMRERIGAMGGAIDVGPHVGGGWQVRISIPVEQHAVTRPRRGRVVIRVMLVDDQEMVRVGFRMILEAEDDITVVGEAADGAEAVELVDRARPDVILMDVRMPRMDGIEACERICRPTQAADHGTRVLMLTTFDLDDYVHAALRAGASGFMLKDAPAEQLVEAIRVVARGEALLAPSVTRALIDEIARRPAGQPDAYPGIDELTEREGEVIVLMARGLSNGEIARQLYLGEATIKTHVGRILSKLGARDRVQAVVAAYESGLVVPGER